MERHFTMIKLHNLIAEDDRSKHGQLMRTVDIERKQGLTKCFKDVGGRKNMNNWSRGMFVIVSPCGHILRWQPLFGEHNVTNNIMYELN